MGAKGQMPAPAYNASNPDHAAQGAGWSAYILPYLEQDNVYVTLGLDESKNWGSYAPNQMACSTYMPIFRCPSDIAPRKFDANGIQDRVPCSFLGVAGNPTEDDGGDFDHLDGIFYNRSEVTIEEIADGQSNTLLVAESLWVWEACMDHWYIGSTNIDSFSGFDFSEFMGSTASPINHWKRVGDLGDCSANTINELAFGSWHLGSGCNAVFADGHVDFLSDSIDPIVRAAIGSRAGGEIIPDIK